MQRLICQQCQAALSWDGQQEIVQCGYCGTRYRMHPRQSGAQGVRVGLGQVSDLQTTHGAYAGRALVRSYVPKDWTVQTNAPEQAPSVPCPLTMQVEYAAPGADAFITYTGTRVYRHLEPSPQNAQAQGQLMMPERIVGLAYRDAGAVCDGILSGNPALSDVRLLSAMNQPDPWAQSLMEQEIRGYISAGTQNPGGTWAKKYATVRDQSGQLWHKQVEAMVLHTYLPVPQEELMLYQMLLQSQARQRSLMQGFHGLVGIMGQQMMNAQQQQMQPPQPKLCWAVQYVVETSATEERFREAMEAHERIRDSMTVLPLFERERARIRDVLTQQVQQDNAVINNAMSQMHQQQMASWDRRQQIIQGTSDYCSNVMEQMRQSNDQTQQRVNNLRSEAIRGVNTYYTNNPGFGVPNVVEASTQWDHVYQNARSPEQFAASTGDAPLEFGVDFEELRKTKGDY